MLQICNIVSSLHALDCFDNSSLSFWRDPRRSFSVSNDMTNALHFLQENFLYSPSLQGTNSAGSLHSGHFCSCTIRSLMDFASSANDMVYLLVRGIGSLSGMLIVPRYIDHPATFDNCVPDSNCHLDTRPLILCQGCICHPVQGVSHGHNLAHSHQWEPLSNPGPLSRCRLDTFYMFHRHGTVHQGTGLQPIRGERTERIPQGYQATSLVFSFQFLLYSILRKQKLCRIL